MLENFEFCKKCTKCCTKTEMILTLNDLKRLKKVSEEFYTYSNGFYRLKNVNGKCIFLENNICKIYELRPMGCRAYPLVYDERRGVILDDDCPLKTIPKKELLKGVKELLIALKEIERDYGYKVNWDLFRRSVNSIF